MIVEFYESFRVCELTIHEVGFVCRVECTNTAVRVVVRILAHAIREALLKDKIVLIDCNYRGGYMHFQPHSKRPMTQMPATGKKGLMQTESCHVKLPRIRTRHHFYSSSQ